jgi:hypothetical protein
MPPAAGRCPEVLSPKTLALAGSTGRGGAAVAGAAGAGAGDGAAAEGAAERPKMPRNPQPLFLLPSVGEPPSMAVWWELLCEQRAVPALRLPLSAIVRSGAAPSPKMLPLNPSRKALSSPSAAASLDCFHSAPPPPACPPWLLNSLLSACSAVGLPQQFPPQPPPAARAPPPPPPPPPPQGALPPCTPSPLLHLPLLQQQEQAGQQQHPQRPSSLGLWTPSLALWECTARTCPSLQCLRWACLPRLCP